MSQEIELKLALTPEGPEALSRHPLLASLDKQTQLVSNTYYDTPSADLEKARVALRVRQVAGRYLQTLKTAGHGGGGLSQRGEWEWEVPGPQLDLTRLATLPSMQALTELDLTSLQPRLATDFTRRRWEVRHGQGRASLVEVVVDEGEIRAGSDSVPIREAELELKLGTAEDLWSLAFALAERVALRPSDSSKAARGNLLLRQEWPLPEASRPEELFHRACLALDGYQDTSRTELLTQATQAFLQLAQHPGLPVEQQRQANILIESLHHDPHLPPAFGQAALRLAHYLSIETELG
ncbi:CYTH domain-containing protein [Halomonas sp. Bachu 37]|uniref:CYTH domain-containing protein n=1 Tax=Halomonas kashgarensis TaxID=3084920 RepID=UPI003217B6F5